MPHENNLRNTKWLNLTIERSKLNNEVVMPAGHNTPIDTQGLSYRKLLKTIRKLTWEESLCYKIGGLAQGWK